MVQVLAQYLMDGTKIIIELVSTDEKAKPVLPAAIDIIKRVLTQHKRIITSLTPELIIAIEQKEEFIGVASFGVGYAKHISPGQPCIVIDVRKFLQEKSGNVHLNEKEFRGAVRHELRHVVDLQKNELQNLRAAASARIKPLIIEIQKRINIASPAYEALRVAYFEVLNAFLLEGLATFCQYPRPYNKRNFRKLYKDAIGKLVSLRFTKSYLKGLAGYDISSRTLTSFKEDIYRTSYAIGWHMVFTIRMYFPQISLRKFLSISPYQFIRIYEQACQKARIKPVVSLYSGKGYFDYNRTIKKLYVIFSRKYKKGKVKYYYNCPNCKAPVRYDTTRCPKCYLDLAPKPCPYCKDEDVPFYSNTCSFCHKKVSIKRVIIPHKKCSACGIIIDLDSKFCPGCGAEQ
jgi:hypothetical protein